MEGAVAESVLEFGDDVRFAFKAARAWAHAHEVVPIRRKE
jgi:hypothetical protein